MADADASVVIVGGGGHARVVAEAVGPDRVVGHLSPEGGEAHVVLGPRLGDDGSASDLGAKGYSFAIGVGFVDRSGAARRARLVGRLDAMRLATVVHERATVAPSADLSDGAFVAAGAIVGADVRVGRAAIVNTGAIVDHDCCVGANVHVAPGVVLSGGVDIGDDTLVGVGATVRQGVRIGRGAVVGAGAVVVDDVPDGAVVVGVPARIVSR